jgi:hypothetical protein
MAGWITNEYDDASLASTGPAGVLREPLEEPAVVGVLDRLRASIFYELCLTNSPEHLPRYIG